MRRLGYCSRLLAASCALAACTTPDEAPEDLEDLEDLGAISDDKSDTALPRTVQLELPAGESKRYRITARGFVASVVQDGDGDVDAELAAKHYDLEYASAVSRAPTLEVPGDDTVRNWTLTVHNRGDATLDASIVVDLPRNAGELGIVSDIDKTVLPPATSAGELTAPYPGIATLLRTLELRQGGAAGDVHYVTARTPDGVVEIPDWMAMHEVPAGSIDTGVSGVPWVAQAEKVRDISRIFDVNATQPFVLFGDTSHRDPEVYAEVRTKYPSRVTAIFIHKVNATVAPARVDGMHLVNNYAEAAAIAYGAELLTEAEARTVMAAARDEGLAITDAEIDALIDAQR